MSLHFHDFAYRRPELSELRAEFKKLTSGLGQAGTAAAQDSFLREINELRQEFESMQSLAYIRHTLDTNDPFYKEEQDYFDENEPLYKELITDYYRALVASPFRRELAINWGDQLFSIAEMTLKTFSPEVIGDL
jgi:hypothetical protein